MFNINCHSVYTYNESICKINDICEKAKNNGFKTITVTDTNSFSSLKKMAYAAKKNELKYIPGLEGKIKCDNLFNYNYLVEAEKDLNKKLNLKRAKEEDKTNWNNELNAIKYNLENNICLKAFKIIFLSKNMNGFKNLIDIFNNEEYDSLNEENLIISDYLFAKNRGNNIVAIFTIDSELDFYINILKNKEKAIECLNNYISSGYEIYIGLDLTRLDSYDRNMNLINFANENNLKIIISNDIRYINKEDRNDYRLFRNILTDRGYEKYDSDNNYYMNEYETREFFIKLGYNSNIIDEYIENNEKLEEECEDFIFPEADKLKDCSKELEKLVIKGWEELRKGTDEEQESWDRFHYELKVINDKNFSQYFLKLMNITAAAYKNDILLGPARGSSGGCEVCYLLKIIRIDPLKYNLLFERFLNPGRQNFPDIDCDFSPLPIGFENCGNQILTDEN